MQLTRRTARLPLARVLALAALLCAAALQVQEAAHGHWDTPGGGYAQCLLCKSSGNAAVPFDVPVGVAHCAVPVDTSPGCGAPRSPAAPLFYPRAPPDYS